MIERKCHILIPLLILVFIASFVVFVWMEIYGHSFLMFLSFCSGAITLYLSFKLISICSVYWEQKKLFGEYSHCVKYNDGSYMFYNSSSDRIMIDCQIYDAKEITSIDAKKGGKSYKKVEYVSYKKSSPKEALYIMIIGFLIGNILGLLISLLFIPTKDDYSKREKNFLTPSFIMFSDASKSLWYDYIDDVDDFEEIKRIGELILEKNSIKER